MNAYWHSKHSGFETVQGVHEQDAFARGLTESSDPEQQRIDALRSGRVRIRGYRTLWSVQALRLCDLDNVEITKFIHAQDAQRKPIHYHVLNGNEKWEE